MLQKVLQRSTTLCCEAREARFVGIDPSGYLSRVGSLTLVLIGLPMLDIRARHGHFQNWNLRPPGMSFSPSITAKRN